MDEHNQQITGGSVNAEKCEVSREKNRLVYARFNRSDCNVRS